MQNFQLSISKIMPARPKKTGTWGVKTTIAHNLGVLYPYGLLYRNRICSISKGKTSGIHGASTCISDAIFVQ